MIRLSRSARTLMGIMGVLVLTSVMISYLYYSNKNSAVDPRVVEARELYSKYNAYTAEASMDSLFRLLASIESIYQSVPHYANSYEIGVISNNRAAAWLTMAIHTDSLHPQRKDSLLNLAEKEIRKSLEIYGQWQTRFADMNEEGIMEIIRPEFIPGLDSFPGEEQQIYLMNRADEIVDSQTEIARRMSVSYTNLGIIYRHRENYEQAMKSYQHAIDLWERNLTAKNNLNILLGQPLEKRNFLQRLFPPERL